LISQSYPIPRAACILFQKTGKGFDALHVRGAQDGLQISRQSARLQQLEQKKKKKASVDSNRQFADIEKAGPPRGKSVVSVTDPFNE
jgi:hypothetical protein